jgi:hypothetical protein
MISNANTPRTSRELVPGMYVGDANVPLNATQVKTLKPGVYADGDGLPVRLEKR